MKRFQECGKIEKTWRYRWYLILPFQWVWHRYINPMVVYIDEYGEDLEGVEPIVRYEIPKGKTLWKILIGNAQFRMRWFHTMDDIMNRLDLRDKSK